MSGHLELHGASLRLYMTYEEAKAILPELRALPGASWNKALNCRTLSASPDALPEIVAFAAKHGVRVPPELIAAAQTTAAVQETGAAESDARALDPRLFPYQRDGVRWLARQDRALIADEMGLGKTVQVLCALPATGCFLVVCPASLKGNWAREVAMWRPDLNAVILSGRGSFRYPLPGQIVITSYELLPKAEAVSPPPMEFTLIVDEAHACKSGKTQRTQAVKALAKLATRAYPMTGTPIMNRPPELFQVLDTFGLAERAFTHFGRYFRLWNATKTRFGTDWGTTPKPELATCLKRVMLRRERTAVLKDLPAKLHKTIPVEIGASLRKKLDRVLEEWLKAEGADRETLTSPEAVREALSGCGLPPFEMMSEVRAIIAEAKTDAAIAVVEEFEEAAEPLVVFSAHVAPIDLIGTRPGWAKITGETPPELRTEIVAAFQRGELKGIAGTIKAMGVGLTLTHSAHELFVDLDWTPALNTQAEDRICRIGQERGCSYTTLTADHPVEWRIAELLQAKTAMTDASVVAAAVETVTTLAETLATAKLEVTTDEDPPVLTRKCPGCKTEYAERISRSTRNNGRGYFSCREDDWFDWSDSVKETGPKTTCRDCGKVTDERRTGDSHKTPGRPYYRCNSCGKFGWLADKFTLEQSANALNVASPEPGASPAREWATHALLRLLSVCDGAMSEDGAGFNKPDSGHARWIAYQITAGQQVSDLVWRDLLDTLHKYKNTQLSDMPAPEDA